LERTLILEKVQPLLEAEQVMRSAEDLAAIRSC